MVANETSSEKNLPWDPAFCHRLFLFRYVDWLLFAVYFLLWQNQNLDRALQKYLNWNLPMIVVKNTGYHLRGYIQMSTLNQTVWKNWKAFASLLQILGMASVRCHHHRP